MHEWISHLDLYFFAILQFQFDHVFTMHTLLLRLAGPSSRRWRLAKNRVSRYKHCIVGNKPQGVKRENAPAVINVHSRRRVALKDKICAIRFSASMQVDNNENNVSHLSWTEKKSGKNKFIYQYVVTKCLTQIKKGEGHFMGVFLCARATRLESAVACIARQLLSVWSAVAWASIASRNQLKF